MHYTRTTFLGHHNMPSWCSRLLKRWVIFSIILGFRFCCSLFRSNNPFQQFVCLAVEWSLFLPDLVYSLHGFHSLGSGSIQHHGGHIDNSLRNSRTKDSIVQFDFLSCQSSSLLHSECFVSRSFALFFLYPISFFSRRDSNTGGNDLWSNTLPLDHGGALGRGMESLLHSFI